MRNESQVELNTLERVPEPDPFAKENDLPTTPRRASPQPMPTTPPAQTPAHRIAKMTPPAGRPHARPSSQRTLQF